ncbi:hypothetical protein [Gordonia sp. UBA6683]|uniref:hypothetical protein n=1 Tax=Gordonia sp. UBA6683 TaxID=1946577 RepID=UPI0025BF8983|nr:hypothetical protein [Gordonia sp. UBA6683]
MRALNRRVIAAVLPLEVDFGGRPVRAGRAHPRRDPDGHPAGGGGGGGNGGPDGGASGSGGGSGSGSGTNASSAGNGNAAGAQGNQNGGGDEFKSEHSKTAVLADLHTAREENKQLKDRLQKLEDANKPEDQKEREAREKRDEQARNDARFRSQAAAAKTAGLGLEWVERIAGSTPEEMLTDAKALKKDLDERSSAGQRTDGAGASGDGDAAATAAPGVSRANAYYANQSKK